MERVITARQKELLGVIYDFFASIGYPPTYKEMRENLGVSSNQSIMDLLEKLRRAGLIRKESGARSLTILPLGYEILGREPLVPMLGATTAGLPAEAIAISGEWRPVSGEVARLDQETFMLKVSGDSMINTGIEDGSIVLVQAKKEFVTNEIVYAEISGEGTIKRFISEDKPPYVYLKPENPAYKNIVFTEDVELKGKVISIFKNNQWVSAK